MSFVSDLRYAVRLLVRQRATALLIIITLALGIGATSAMFSVINGVLLRPLPFAAPDRIVQVGGLGAPADFLDFTRETATFASIAGYVGQVVDLSDGTGDPERLGGLQVTDQFFDVFGVPAAVGRTFDRAHAANDRGTTVVIGHEMWQRRFGGAASVLGRTVRVNGQPRTIIGVMPAGFAWGEAQENGLWMLASSDIPDSPIEVQGELRAARGVNYFQVIARLTPGQTLAHAQGDVDRVARGLAERFPTTNAQRRYTLTQAQEQLVGRLRPALFVLLGAVACVLLIACANVANLLLARAGDRHREMAIRTALGAGRLLLVRQLLFESVVLAVIGGLCGLLVARAGVAVLVALAPQDVPRLNEIGVDRWVVAFTFAICLITGVLFGAAPALQTSRVTPQDVLREAGTRTVGGGRRARLTRSVLVVSQLALALMLVVGASLMVTSFSRLESVDPGFRSEQVVSVQLPVPMTRYPSPQRQAQFYADVLERLHALPLAHSATVGFPLPLSATNATTSVKIEGRENRPDDKPTAALTLIAPDYFRTLGVPLVQGRDFTAQDSEKAPRVLIVNRAFARKHFPGESALGHRLEAMGNEKTTIVGVVGDVRGYGLDQEAPPTMYVPYRQLTLPFMGVLVRTSASAGDVAQSLRAIVRQIDPEMPIDDVETLEQVVGKTIAQPKFRTTLLTAFAGAALVLAIVGVYGVISYTVSQRRREMGIRAALGASPVDLLRLVLRQGLILALAGVAAGLLGAFALSGLLKGLLYGVAATDPMTLVSSTAALIAVAILACALPAWRTMRLDPLSALRDD
jgi:putative ABC transport system permease protein